MIWTIPMNESKTGLDWDWIRDNYVRRASPEEVAAQIRSLARNMNTLTQPVKKKSPNYRLDRAAENHPNRVSDENKQLIHDYYIAGNKVPWIAGEIGVTEATVRAHLRSADVYDPDRDRGRK